MGLLGVERAFRELKMGEYQTILYNKLHFIKKRAKTIKLEFTQGIINEAEYRKKLKGYDAMLKDLERNNILYIGNWKELVRLKTDIDNELKALRGEFDKMFKDIEKILKLK